MILSLVTAVSSKDGFVNADLAKLVISDSFSLHCGGHRHNEPGGLVAPPSWYATSCFLPCQDVEVLLLEMHIQSIWACKMPLKRMQDFSQGRNTAIWCCQHWEVAPRMHQDPGPAARWFLLCVIRGKWTTLHSKNLSRNLCLITNNLNTARRHVQRIWSMDVYYCCRWQDVWQDHWCQFGGRQCRIAHQIQ